MLENGFVKFDRKIANWRWYHDVNTFKLFFHLIITANYEPKPFENITVQRGQRVASYQSLAAETQMSVQNVRTALNHLISTGEVTRQSTSKYTVFTIVNYNMYQDNQQTNQQTANKQLTNNQQTANNNGRKIKKDKEIYAAPAAHTNGRRTDNPGATDF
jgi:DNA-binding transcriptional regulator YhcF (GntR family)